jgi:4,5-DOPA dioxygenase extradiol
MGLRLKPLREEGVLIFGSGNIVHNLAAYRWSDKDKPPFEWAIRFETHVRNMVTEDDYDSLIDYQKFDPDAHLAVPIPDHYLPFLYILGLRRNTDKISYPVKGIDGGSISMLAVQLSSKSTPR